MNLNDLFEGTGLNPDQLVNEAGAMWIVYRSPVDFNKFATYKAAVAAHNRLSGRGYKLASAEWFYDNVNVGSTPVVEAQGDTVEAHGIRGMKRTAWRRTFKNREALDRWADANDSVEIYGTRDTDSAARGSLSPAMGSKTNEELVSESNFNDDDWYEISADAKSVVGTISQRPQGAVTGRPVKLPNGNYAIKGMQARHMGLQRGMAEGRMVKGPGGVDLDRRGNPIPVKAPAVKQEPRDQYGLTKDAYTVVWSNIRNVVSQIFPDGDPIDYLGPWMEKMLRSSGGSAYDSIEVLTKASKLNGYNDIYDYYDSFKTEDNGYNESAYQQMSEADKKGLYYNVNKRKAAGTSRDADSPKAPTAQAWKDAAKTAKNEGVAEAFDSAAFDRHMDKLRAQKELEKTDPMRALINNLHSDDARAAKMKRRGPSTSDDTNTNINSPFHPSQGVNIGEQGVAEHKGVKHRYQMTHQDGTKMKFTATDDADARRQAKEHDAKSFSKVKDGAVTNKVTESANAELASIKRFLAR
tara:strand:+ start:16143 stop:17711 length:1569 start_codon:yes stop_codon:yes gene_type:complete